MESWDETAGGGWQPVTGAAVIGLALLVGYVVWQHYFTPDRWVFLLDNTNLALHEAGHPIVGLLVPGLAVYGGTLFQLLFPALFAGHFRRQRHGLGWSVALAWFGESLLNVGRYMADARAHAAADDQGSNDGPGFPQDRHDDDDGKQRLGTKADHAFTGVQRQHRSDGCTGQANERYGFGAHLVDLPKRLPPLVRRQEGEDRRARPHSHQGLCH